MVTCCRNSQPLTVWVFYLTLMSRLLGPWKASHNFHSNRTWWDWCPGQGEGCQNRLGYEEECRELQQFIFWRDGLLITQSASENLLRKWPGCAHFFYECCFSTEPSAPQFVQPDRFDRAIFIKMKWIFTGTESGREPTLSQHPAHRLLVFLPRCCLSGHMQVICCLGSPKFDSCILKSPNFFP